MGQARAWQVDHLPMTTAPEFNARRHARTACVISVSASTAGGIRRGVCRSVSPGGAFITGIPQVCGGRLELQLEVPGLGEIHAAAKVSYQHKHPDGEGVGVIFTEISKGDQARLERFIDLFARPRG